MNKFLIPYTLLLVSIISSCASILNPKYQSVQIKTENPLAKVYIDDSLVGEGESMIVKIKRDMSPKQIRVDAEGYESHYKSLIQIKRSGLYFFSVIPFGVTFFPLILDGHPKAFNYPKIINTGLGQKELVTKDSSKIIMLNDFNRNIAIGNYKLSKIDIFKYLNVQTNPASYTTIADPYYIQNIENGKILWPKSFQDLLIQNKITDTTNLILTNPLNALYLNADMTSLNLISIYRKFTSGGTVSFLRIEATINWELKDAYKQTIYKKSEKILSDEFAYQVGWLNESHFNQSKETLDLVYSNTLYKGMISLMEDDSVKKIMKLENTKVNYGTIYSINQTKKVKTVSESIKACVTIKTKDGHGSGFFIGDNGEILTNYHVIAGNDTVEIIRNDGKKYKAVVERIDTRNDLALLKSSSTDHYVMALNTGKIGEIGEDIFVVGTPSSIELTQTLSKGIISGERFVENERIIQTDASINGGNSGGPMISKNAELIGIVSSKLIGRGIEGIGFVIPINTIDSILKIKVSQ